MEKKYFIFILKRPAPVKGAGFFSYRYTAFQSCAFRVHFVCITPVFCAHGTANFHLKLFSVGNRKACISVFFSKYRLFNSGGQRGIRTLDTLLTYTRVPVVRLRPAQPSVHTLVRVMGLEPIRLSTHAPQTCLSAYSSTLAKYFNIIQQIEKKVNRLQYIFIILQNKMFHITKSLQFSQGIIN